MKKSLYLLPIAIFFLSASAKAQKANIDSLTLVAQISQDQLSLGKLQNMVEEKTKNKMGASVEAQNSANENANAANRLNADPDNKKLASNASDKASNAKSDARKSRNESGKLDDLNKKIMDLRIKIAGEQAKLALYSPIVMNAPALMPAPARSDTTLHP